MEKKNAVMKKVGIGLVIVIIAFSGYFVVDKLLKEDIISTNKTGYIAGSVAKVSLYDMEFNKVIDVVRGSKVVVKKDEFVNESDNTKYIKIEHDKKDYLIRINSLVYNVEDVVLEDKLYVRTPLTIYKDESSSSILSMAKKGTELEIIGYDKIDEEGLVNRYKVVTGDFTGFVYGKYLVSTKDEALKNYDEEGTYKIHSSRGNTQGGGAASNLDFYPYKKPAFENNVMPSEVRSLYLNTGVIGNVDAYISLAKNSNINAFVVDIKDNTSPGYPALAMKELSPTNYKKANNSYNKYKQAIQKLLDEGFYVIGRITVFKDSYYVQDHPEAAIMDNDTGLPFKHNGSHWPTAFSRDVWEFNIELAKESVKEMGFHEIQFDYVRFPDRTYQLEKAGKMDMRNIYNEDKAQAIQGFLMYACDEIHQLGAYVSADVFGESAHNYVTGYGQYWAAISNVVDVISAMPYPDHFSAYEYGFSDIVWTVPYDLLYFWGNNYAAKRQTEIPTPAKVRTWIQAYNAIRSPYIEYDHEKVSDQIRGLYDAGLTGGYMTWNAGSSLEKYKSLAPAFKKEY
jgi:hypothetical protein